MKTRFLSLLGLTLTLSNTSTAIGCPAYLEAEKLSSLDLKARQNLRAFAMSAKDGKRSWVTVPIQVDELDQRGVLAGSNPTKPLAMTDRISLRIETFGERIAATDMPPCSGKKALEIENPNQPGKFAYLTGCEDVALVTALPVEHNSELKTVTSQHYDYQYLPNNQLMYKSLVAKDTGWKESLPAASNSDLTLHLDIKRFLTLNFTNKNVESYVGRSASGPVGMVGSIDFYLRLLFMKIDLKLGTTVGFYGDSAHIPSIIDVPVDAHSRLNAGSGLLYMWQTENATIDRSPHANAMLDAKPSLIKEGWENYAKEGSKFCRKDNCAFSLRGSIGTLPYGIDIYLEPSMVARGFYPVWVSDVGKFKKELGWEIAESDPGKVGIFFNNSGLPKGQYPMNQWIRLGSSGMLGQCPAPISVKETLTFNQNPVIEGTAH